MTPTTILVYSDASIAPGGAAWGGVVVRDRAAREYSGRFAGVPRSSTEAELWAAGNVVHAALTKGLIKPGDRVVVHCDNAVAAALLDGERFRKNRPDLAAPVNYLRALGRDRGFEIAGAWVKGHQPASSKCRHAALNRRADQLAGLLTQTSRVRRSRARPPKRERERIRREAKA